MKTIIVWLRNDLRLHDHPALWQACQEADQVVPVFIWNPGLLHGIHGSSNRNRFLLECLQDLRQNLQAKQADLVLRSGDPVDELNKLVADTKASAVYYTIDYSPYARQRDSKVTKALPDVDVQAFAGKLMLDSFQSVLTKTGQIYKVFTPFWRNWSTIDRRAVHGLPPKIPFPATIQVGELPKLADITTPDNLSGHVLKGGETAGRQRLKQFIDREVQHYADNHNWLQPEGGTSQLSPYLKFGCVSVGEIETMLGNTKGEAAFHRQLCWRDFYNYTLFHYPNNATTEFQERYRDLEWNDNPRHLKAWQQGQTGYPIVDAAMRQLAREGWMHNRARLIVGSFLTKDLGLDWREGESWFMKFLVDGDEANNNGNWQWIASVGVDPAPAFRRMYNPMTQQDRYDPDGSYVRFYVPELGQVPDKYLKEPWKMSDEERVQFGCKDYPAPVVDHAVARREALARYRRS